MKFAFSALSIVLSIGVSLARPSRDVFDHGNIIKDAVLEKRVTGLPFLNSQLEKRASPYLNEKSKSAFA